MQKPTEVSYEIATVDGKFLSLILPHREGRMPIAKTIINSDACIVITGNDGMLEILGLPSLPPPTNVIELLRTHNEGMLLVEIFEPEDPRAKAYAPGLPPVAGEQMLKAPLSLS